MRGIRGGGAQCSGETKQLLVKCWKVRGAEVASHWFVGTGSQKGGLQHATCRTAGQRKDPTFQKLWVKGLVYRVNIIASRFVHPTTSYTSFKHW